MQMNPPNEYLNRHIISGIITFSENFFKRTFLLKNGFNTIMVKNIYPTTGNHPVMGILVKSNTIPQSEFVNLKNDRLIAAPRNLFSTFSTVALNFNAKLIFSQVVPRLKESDTTIHAESIMQPYIRHSHPDVTLDFQK